MATTRIRLQKYLSSCGVASRRKSEELITRGEVSVNGRRITELGTRIDPTNDVVTVGKKVVRQQHKGLMVLHKPRNVVSTMHDPQGRPALGRYVSKKISSYNPVGRLDFESTGLVLFTNDGELSEWLLHPRYQIPRVYEVTVRGAITERQLERLREGITLEDGVAYGDASFTTLRGSNDDPIIRIVVREGRNRLVRRMFAALKHPVTSLHRTEHGPFRLGKVREGTISHLSERRYRELRRITQKQVEDIVSQGLRM